MFLPTPINIYDVGSTEKYMITFLDDLAPPPKITIYIPLMHIRIDVIYTTTCIYIFTLYSVVYNIREVRLLLLFDF